MIRPEHYRFHNSGAKDALPFAVAEYEDRLAGLRDIMELHSLDAVVLTSMHNVAYYSGFLYCTFGRPYACVVTKTDCVTVSAGIDAGQPWRRSVGDNITYTDWKRDNFWRVVASITGIGKAIGCEADHLTMERAEKLNTFLQPNRGMDI
ncbi:MAG: aminopeptidase P family N-terminal domain-containing protein, partial [Paracoccaceae bacterium]